MQCECGFCWGVTRSRSPTYPRSEGWKKEVNPGLTMGWGEERLAKTDPAGERGEVKLQLRRKIRCDFLSVRGPGL